ncbi:RNA-guided endonuclease InsQ/TnpB family protein [Natranaerobius thermophilus]|uniref:Putative transposase IS891/IS1136/IS1341 family n=1 Tax=Natranaerobius thermophilus (strain ATCC BAA-1301 / DSM 18059 / JW/NM-WN-LF) TaxID=457570 RepID=B2A1B1_NATTJ|nr:RNA-guided endonuclease TnpB family protein [Natranaerobius thermophilus]ACB86049.1 putative transposase IS891/IS1136/IS1341 family [Natranaerobius thermophilus JW/NM-WN-LF]
MIITKTYKYKLYESKKNKNIHQKIDIAGLIYNHCIALHKRYYKLTGKHLNKFQLMKHITKLKKKDKYQHWNLVGSQAIQDIVDRIDRAYQLFFRNLKHGIKTSPPKFKKIKKYKSFTLKQAGWKYVDDNLIKIGKKVYKFSKSRELPENIKTVTIKRDPLGDLYICFVVKEKIEVPDRQGKSSIGLDFGLKTFLVASDGTKYEAPFYYHHKLKELKKAQKELSSKEKGSNNRNKARKKVFRLHKKVVNQRRAYFFKLAHELTDKYEYIFIEDLNMKAMQKMWGKKIQDLGYSTFVEILEYVAKKKGSRVVKVDRFYPSSKICSKCGEINQNLKLSDRIFECDCGLKIDRDLNAAINIHMGGASSIGLGNVRPAIIEAVSA